MKNSSAILCFRLSDGCWCQSSAGAMSGHQHSRAAPRWVLRMRRSPLVLTPCKSLWGAGISPGQAERREKKHVFTFKGINSALSKDSTEVIPSCVTTTWKSLLQSLFSVRCASERGAPPPSTRRRVVWSQATLSLSDHCAQDRSKVGDHHQCHLFLLKWNAGHALPLAETTFLLLQRPFWSPGGKGSSHLYPSRTGTHACLQGIGSPCPGDLTTR